MRCHRSSRNACPFRHSAQFLPAHLRPHSPPGRFLVPGRGEKTRRRRTNATAPSCCEDECARTAEGRLLRRHDPARFGRGAGLFGVQAVCWAVILLTRRQLQLIADRPVRRHSQRLREPWHRITQQPVGQSDSVSPSNRQPISVAGPIGQFSHRCSGHRRRRQCWVPGSPASRTRRNGGAGRRGKPGLPPKGHQRPVTPATGAWPRGGCRRGVGSECPAPKGHNGVHGRR
jgi:hypothetical protein